jgi:hypothetical protein
MPNVATDTTAAEFDALYLKSQPEQVQSLMQMPGGVSRVATAVNLAQAGYLIDGTIMVWDWSPYQTMKSRMAYGYTWVPSYLQKPIQIAPGVSQGASGPPSYDAAVIPPGALLVTLDMDLLPTLFPAPKK